MAFITDELCDRLDLFFRRQEGLMVSDGDGRISFGFFGFFFDWHQAVFPVDFVRDQGKVAAFWCVVGDHMLAEFSILKIQGDIS